MPNTFSSGTVTETLTNLKPTGGIAVVVTFVVLAVLVVVAYTWWPGSRTVCPKDLHRHEDGHLSLRDAGKTFSDMNGFQQWWHSSGLNNVCPLPRLTGARVEHDVLVDGAPSGGWPNEQTFARTPIYKVDDYEFSRIFGNERDGHMQVAKRDYNLILEDRQRDWANLPVSAEARRDVYAGLHEGFTASGEMSSAREAAARYGEKAHAGAQAHEDGMDVECKLSREAKEVAAMVAKAYEDDPDYEPVITKVGANHWEVNELKPRHRKVEYSDPVDNRVVNTADHRVHKEFKYEQDRVNHAVFDPFFPADALSEGELPWRSERMDRMMGPTFDRADWSVPAPGGLAHTGLHPLMAPETPN